MDRHSSLLIYTTIDSCACEFNNICTTMIPGFGGLEGVEISFPS